MRAIVTTVAVGMTVGVGVVPGHAAPAGRWRLAYCAPPGATYGGQLVYDAAARQLVAALGTGGGSLVSRDGGKCWTTPAGAGPTPRSLASVVYDPGTRRVVLFGGASGQVLYSDTWNWDGRSWSQYSGTGPSARAGATAVYDRARSEVVLFGGLGGPDPANKAITNAPLGDTWVWESQRQSWRQAATGGPPARSGASMVFDPASKQVVLVGGSSSSGVLSDTWTWNGRVWTKRALTELPARTNAAMAYDDKTHQVVLFGGQSSAYTGPSTKYLADTWTWNGARWQQRGVGPSPRAQAAMAYDQATGEVVLHGGINVNHTFGDSWIWTGSRWVAQSGNTPPPRTNSSLVYDEAHRRMLLFGGIGEAYPSNVSGWRDAWSWDGHRWSMQTGPVISRSSTVYDPAIGKVVLHGWGAYDFNSDDTFLWDGRRWSHVGGPEPPGRTGQAMVYDAARREVVVFGGVSTNTFSSQQLLGDTWTFSGKQWVQHHVPGPVPRAHASMAYDAATRQVVLFGGSNYDNHIPTSGGSLGDTWTWDGRHWTEHSGEPQPSARVGQSFIYDGAHGKVVMFGGYGPASPLPERGEGVYANDDVYLRDTWTWNGTTWKQISGAGPSPRRDAQVVFDGRSSRVLLFGGVGPDNPVLQAVPVGVEDPALTPDPSTCSCVYPATFLGDAWTWDGSRWIQQAVHVPPARSAASAAYDPTGRQLVVFGGQHNKGSGAQSGSSEDAHEALGDTWTFGSAGWQPRTGPSPSPRFSASLVNDAATRQLVMFGGLDGSASARLVLDTWTWG